MKKHISIQIWTDSATVWDHIKPTFHYIAEAGEVAQAIADATQQQVRMTYYNIATGMQVGRNNGHYFNPAQTVITINSKS